jgi:hypothetical protein
MAFHRWEVVAWPVDDPSLRLVRVHQRRRRAEAHLRAFVRQAAMLGADWEGYVAREGFTPSQARATMNP